MNNLTPFRALILRDCDSDGGIGNDWSLARCALQNGNAPLTILVKWGLSNKITVRIKQGALRVQH
jgi:hypothetical protein